MPSQEEVNHEHHQSHKYFHDELSQQVPKEHGAMNNGEQVNDHTEEDDHADNIVEDDGINTLIHDLFNVRWI